MIGFPRIVGVQELMDADDLPDNVYSDVVGDLARVNRVTMAARPTLAFLKRIVPDTKTLRLLDVGYGDGDMLRTIAHWAQRRGLKVDLVGVDLNRRSEAAAKAHTPQNLPIRFVTGDYLDLADEHWDVIISNLVAHHMTHDELLAFLCFMEKNARQGWFINDLHRHRLAYRGYPVLARLMLCHRIVRLDGTLSIARSYRPNEWLELLAKAGVQAARVFRAFPFRLCVERRR